MTDMSRRVARQPTRKRTFTVAFGIENDSGFNSHVVPFTRVRTTELDIVRNRMNNLSVQNVD